jgi:hypothetical protein
VNKPKEHSILAHPHQYDICDFHYHVDNEDRSLSFIDLSLRKDLETVVLRFWQPINLKIETGFPEATGGMVFYDVSADQMENIGVEVADFEASWGAITFLAKRVERLSRL